VSVAFSGFHENRIALPDFRK